MEHGILYQQNALLILNLLLKINHCTSAQGRSALHHTISLVSLNLNKSSAFWNLKSPFLLDRSTQRIGPDGRHISDCKRIPF